MKLIQTAKNNYYKPRQKNPKNSVVLESTI